MESELSDGVFYCLNQNNVSVEIDSTFALQVHRL